eukprot:6212764-Pleurochrysis_carterae.AAC.2
MRVQTLQVRGCVEESARAFAQSPSAPDRFARSLRRSTARTTCGDIADAASGVHINRHFAYTNRGEVLMAAESVVQQALCLPK